MLAIGLHQDIPLPARYADGATYEAQAALVLADLALIAAESPEHLLTLAAFIAPVALMLELPSPTLDVQGKTRILDLLEQGSSALDTTTAR